MSYTEPALPALLFLGVVGLAAAWRRSEKGRRPWLLTLSVVGLVLLSMNVVAWLLAQPLEAWYDNEPFPQEPAEAIVILAGTIRKPMANGPYMLAGKDTYERLQHGIWLFRHWKSAPILVCGGDFGEKETYAESMAGMLKSEGIPSELIWIENRSRSTRENAVYASEVLRAHGVSRIALVVQASSMLRAAAAFRKTGIDVIPAPIRFAKLDRTVSDVLPNWRAISLNDETIHEFVGLAWYRLRGWI